MMSVKVTFLPMRKEITVKQGTTLLQAGRRAGVHIPTRCGGRRLPDVQGEGSRAGAQELE